MQSKASRHPTGSGRSGRINTDQVALAVHDQEGQGMREVDVVIVDDLLALPIDSDAEWFQSARPAASRCHPT